MGREHEAENHWREALQQRDSVGRYGDDEREPERERDSRLDGLLAGVGC